MKTISDNFTQFTRNLPTTAMGLLVGAGLAMVPAFAQGMDLWLTVDQPGFEGAVNSLVYDRSPVSLHQGTLYAAGDQDLALATIRKSTDAGQTWQASDSFIYPGKSSSQYMTMAVDPSGVAYAAGGGSGTWFVRKSIDGGANWLMVDDYIRPNVGSGPHFPRGMAIDADGTLYVAGQVSEQVNKRGAWRSRWLVRRSTDGGATWSVVDDYLHDSDAEAWGVTISQGAIHVVGGGSSNGGKYWLVRRGLPQPDGSIAWQNIDTFQLTAGRWSVAHSVSADTEGNIYVTGRGASLITITTSGSGKPKTQQVERWSWVARKLFVSGSWQTIDTYRLADEYSAWPSGIAAAANGTVMVTGYAANAAGTSWVTRKLDAAGQWSVSDLVPNSYGGSVITDVAGTVFTGGMNNLWNWTIRALAE